MQYKECIKCKIKKPLSEFYFRKDTYSYRNDCKECNNIQSKKYREFNIEKFRIKQKEYRNKNKNKLNKQTAKWRKDFPWKKTLSQIKQRCNNPNNPDYKHYGGRGIKCKITSDELKELWFRDKAYNMDKPSIDRINSNGNYTFKNCKYIEQTNNIGKMNKETKSKQILQCDLNDNFIKEWESIKEAGRKNNMFDTAICNCLKGKCKTSGGFIWKYKLKEKE